MTLSSILSAFEFRSSKAACFMYLDQDNVMLGHTSRLLICDGAWIALSDEHMLYDRAWDEICKLHSAWQPSQEDMCVQVVCMTRRS